MVGGCISFTNMCVIKFEGCLQLYLKIVVKTAYARLSTVTDTAAFAPSELEL